MNKIVQFAAYGCILLLSQMSLPAAAQESLPPLSFEPNALRDAGARGFSMDDRPDFTFDNEYLNDTLRLQYQNILLEKMITRQGAIARTEKSFMEVGVPFDQPAPPRGICEQIPVNVPCYKAYPDLYPGAVSEVGQIEDGALNEPELPASMSPATPAKSDSQKPKKPQVAEKPAADFSAYRWAEITCAGGRCSAVISHKGARRSVKEGQSLDGGFTVSRITATGVELSHEGKSQPIEAALAPSRGGLASPKYAGYSATTPIAPPSGSLSQQAQQIQGQFSNAPSTPIVGDIPDGEEAAVSVAPESEPEPVADPGPPLGPTGLF